MGHVGAALLGKYCSLGGYFPRKFGAPQTVEDIRHTK